MKLFCNGVDLSDAVAKVIKAVSTHTELKILEGIKLTALNDCLVLTATNNEISIEKRIRADIAQEGEVVVNGKLLHSLAAKMGDGQISFSSLPSGALRIEFKDVKTDVACMSADEFPPFRALGGASYQISQKVIKSIIAKVAFSVNQGKDDRPILKGVCLEIEDGVLNAVALDGYRLAYATARITPEDSNITVVVPGKALEEMGRLMENSDEPVSLYIQRNFMMAEFPDLKFTARMLDGVFVQYKQIIPKAFTTEVVCEKAQFEECIDLANIFASNTLATAAKVDLDFRDNSVFSSLISEQGDMNNRAAANITGKDIAIAFNIRYLLDAVKALDGEFFKLSMNTPSSPCVITPVDAEMPYLFLILPVYNKGR